MNTIDFSFSDMIAGYIKQVDKQKNEYTIETSDSRVFTFKLTDNTYAELIRNLSNHSLIVPDR
jgi:hypothetical protein